MRTELQLYIRANVGSAVQLKVSADEHADIVAALAAGDQERCGAAFGSHVLNGKHHLIGSTVACGNRRGGVPR